MACILCPGCNFLHGYFRCQLPMETIDMEVKINPSLVQKMRTYLELEERLGPKSKNQPQTQLQQVHMQQNQQKLAQPSTNSTVRKSPTPKVNDKRRKPMIAKRGYKVRVLTQPTPSAPTLTAPVPTVATISTHTPRPTAKTIPVAMYKQAMGQFAEVPHPATRSLNDNSPPLEDIPRCQLGRVPLGPMQDQHQ